jgi:hypothetical protein
MAHLDVEIGALTRVPPLRILPVPPAPPRSRHPFRAGHLERAVQVGFAGRGGRLVQGALRSPGCALGTRSRCMRGTQVGSGYTVVTHPRGPPLAVLVNSDLTFIGLLMEGSGEVRSTGRRRPGRGRPGPEAHRAGQGASRLGVSRAGSARRQRATLRTSRSSSAARLIHAPRTRPGGRYTSRTLCSPASW